MGGSITGALCVAKSLRLETTVNPLISSGCGVSGVDLARPRLQTLYNYRLLILRVFQLTNRTTPGARRIRYRRSGRNVADLRVIRGPEEFVCLSCSQSTLCAACWQVICT